MTADLFSQNNSLAFPLSLEEAAGPEVEGPSRFARALKRARFARGWTQAKLAAQLAIPKRSIVSWETGERIPSIGMVRLLLDAVFPGEELSFHRELITAYIVDDLERKAQRRDSQRGQDDPLLQRVQRVMAQVLQPSMSATQARPAIGHQEASGQADEQQALEPLFALIEQLRQHPELIPVARDFIRELAPSG
jgi:transcriptional regulator with XRE-family HTH domain